MPDKIIANEVDLRDLARARQSLFLGGALDSKRPRAWEQYGYQDTLTFDLLYQAYSRGGAGFGAVHHILDRCWQEWPRIKRKDSDAETPWETKVKDTLDAINGWGKVRDWDRRNMVGRFAGLILRVRDGKKLSEPLLRRQGMRLVDLVPVYENQLRVQSWDTDSESETFGQPTMWQYRVRPLAANDQQGRPDKFADLHPSRLLILAEGAVGDDFFDGVPLLSPGFNHLTDLEKVSGGSGESFLKNSARTLVIEYEAEADVRQIAGVSSEASDAEVVAAAQEKTDKLNRNQDSSLILTGGKANTLQTAVADPEPSFRVAANLFSASVRIPSTILFGQQTGRLASDQDLKADNAQMKARQRNVLTPAVTALVRRLQGCGVLEDGDFEVQWAPLDAPGDADKLGLAKTMAETNKIAAEAGDVPPYRPEEVRKAGGYEQEGMPDEPLMREGGADDDEGDDPPAPSPTPPEPAPRPTRAANEAGFIRRLIAALRRAA